MCLPSFWINTLQGGFNKRPCLVPGGSGVWLSRRVQLSCGSHAALQYNSSSVFPIRRQLQRTQISHGLFCAICYSSAVIYYALLLQAHCCLQMKGQEQREGRWVRGSEVASACHDRRTKGRNTGREGSERLLLVLRHLFYLLANEVAQKRECKWGRRHRA